MSISRRWSTCRSMPWSAKTIRLRTHSAVTSQELAELPLILLDLPLSAEYFLALFMKEGLQPNIAFRFSHPDIIRTMVANGYGYTLANVTPRSDTALDGRTSGAGAAVGRTPADDDRFCNAETIEEIAVACGLCQPCQVLHFRFLYSRHDRPDHGAKKALKQHLSIN